VSRIPIKFRRLSKLLPPATAIVRVELALWEGAKFYARMHAADYPDPTVNDQQRAFLMLLSFEPVGLAVRYTDANGDVTFKATPKCPGRDSCPDGFVTLSMTLLQ
jgi:hypothetical protein